MKRTLDKALHALFTDAATGEPLTFDQVYNGVVLLVGSAALLVIFVGCALALEPTL